MNPWDLSCRSANKVTQVGLLNDERPISAQAQFKTDLVTMRFLHNLHQHQHQQQQQQQQLQQNLLNAKTNFHLPNSHSTGGNASTNATAGSTHSSILSRSPTSFSDSSSPASSRSNSITTNDDVANQGLRLKLASLTCDKVNKNNLDLSEDDMALNLLQLDKKARKKDQNRRAAYNYRRKKMEEKNRLREEEMRLVYSRVCLIGYAEELEGSIIYILNSKTRKILDKDGNAICFLCPVCLQSCDNILNLRNHLNTVHWPSNAIADT